MTAAMFEPKDRNIPYWEDLERLEKIDAYVKEQWKNGKREAICCMYDCSTREFWKLFEQKKVWVDFEEIQGQGKDKFANCRTCWRCVMARENLETEADARAWILTHKPDYERRRKDHENFESAKKHQFHFFTMMSGQEKHKAIKILEKMGSFVQVFTPLAQAIIMKDSQMTEKSGEWTEAQKMIKELRELKDSSKVLDAIDRVMLMTAEVPLLAFKNDPDGRRKWFATTYADEWSGYMGGWFRSWYICLHGCGWEGKKAVMNERCCGTLIPSKLWNLKIEDDPLAEGQRWYCWQHHRYNTSHGQVVEFRTVGGSLMYARASIPSGTIQDIRAIAIEEKVGKDATAEEIYDSLEIIAPQTEHENIFVHKEAPKATGNEWQRWFGIDIEFYNKLPIFPWYQIFNMTGAPLMEVAATEKEAGKRAKWEVDEKKKELSRRIEARIGTSASSLSTEVSSGASAPSELMQMCD